MRLLPVAERELRVAARRPGVYWTRFAAAGAAFAGAGLVLLATSRESAVERSQALFVTLSGLALLYCLFCGVLTTADCVTEEKREGTLGLLFLTNLKGYDVVIGKMLAGSVRAVSALVAFVPVIGMSLLMGGVPGRTVGLMAMVLFNTLFLSLSLGVIASVLARDPRRAVGGTLLALLTLLVFLPVLRVVLLEYFLPRPVAMLGGRSGLVALGRWEDWLLLANPVVLAFCATEGLTSVLGRTPDVFWIALAVQHGLSWLALLTAFLVLPRVWRDRVERTASAGVMGAGRGPEGRQWRREVLERMPMAWQVLREGRVVTVTWCGLAVLGACWLWGLAEVGDDWLTESVAVFTAFLAGGWVKVRVVMQACRLLHEQRRSGALELVLCTPVSLGEVIGGTLAGMRHLFFPPIATVLAATGLLLVSALGESRGVGAGTQLIFLVGVGVAVLLLDVWTLAWAGLWLGARSRRYVRALGVTAGIVLVLPWVLYFVSIIVWVVLMETVGMPSAQQDPGIYVLVAWWAVVAAVVDGVMVAKARRGLPLALRETSLDGREMSPGSPIRPASVALQTRS